MQQPLHHKSKGTDSHHQEGGQGNAVGVACAYGGYCLWKVAQYHAETGYITEYVVYCRLVHSYLVVSLLKTTGQGFVFCLAVFYSGDILPLVFIFPVKNEK